MAADKLFSVVTTTIHVPRLLEAYVEDALTHGRHLEQVVVAGDRKTPPEAEALCEELERTSGVRCRYLDPADQELLLERYPGVADFLPWNCVQRRNVGLLAAYEGEADVVVTIDDDNFVAEPDYFGGHLHVGDMLELDAIRSETGWWNVCELLEEARGMPFYARGHPLSQRWNEGEAAVAGVEGRVVVNAGLWLADPDVDALTRMTFPVRATRRRDGYARHVALDVGTWAPINSQNTALLREILPAYFLFPNVGRYDDIWAGYVLRHVMDALGDLVTYGSPLVRQDRNVHDYWRDLDDERLGLVYTDVLLQALRACPVEARDYRGGLADVAAAFPAAIAEACDEHGVDRRLFDPVSDGLAVWAGAFAELVR